MQTHNYSAGLSNPLIIKQVSNQFGGNNSPRGDSQNYQSQSSVVCDPRYGQLAPIPQQLYPAPGLIEGQRRSASTKQQLQARALKEPTKSTYNHLPPEEESIVRRVREPISRADSGKHRLPKLGTPGKQIFHDDFTTHQGMKPKPKKSILMPKTRNQSTSNQLKLPR